MSTDPLSGPTDDVEEPKHAPAEPAESTGDEDGSEWIPEPEPADGDGPLP